MAWLNIYQTIKQVVQDAVAPEIQGLKGEIAGVKAEIKVLSDRIDSLEKRLDQRIDGLEKRMDGFERQLELALDVRERLAVVEARLERR